MFRGLGPNLRIWSRFSEEKQLDFNGSVVTGPDGVVLVDPVAMSEEDAAELRERGAPVAIVITNRDHRRAAPELKRAFGDIPIWIHEADRDLMDTPADRTFKDGDRLPAELLAIHLPHMKSPGETALYLEDGPGTLILGDALIGKPAGSLSLLPPAKVPDPAAARESLGRLLDRRFDVLMLGDGQPFAAGGRAALERFLSGP